MRIALVASEYPPEPHGGIGAHTRTLACELAARGHEVVVVGLAEADGERRDGPVRVVRLACSRVRWLGGAWSRLRLARWLRRLAPEVVEVPEFEGLLPFAVPGARVVVRLHLSATTIARRAGRRPSPAVRLFERLTLARHRDWIGVSNHALELTRREFGLEPGRAEIIPCPVAAPVATTTAAPPVPGPFILFGGTVSVRKGTLDLAEAAAGLLAERPGLSLVFAGPVEAGGYPPLDARLLERVAPADRSRVHFTGRVPQEAMRALMSAATVFAFPSRLETLGLVVVEAMLAGAPVVAPAEPPFTELLEDERTGLLVSMDEPGALRAALRRLLDDPALARRLGEAGRQAAAERFASSMIAGRTLAFYGEARDRRPHRRA